MLYAAENGDPNSERSPKGVFLLQTVAFDLFHVNFPVKSVENRNMMAFLKNPKAFAGGAINMNFRGMDSWQDVKRSNSVCSAFLEENRTALT